MRKVVITTLLIAALTCLTGCAAWRWLNTEPHDPHPEWGDPMDPTWPVVAVTNPPAK